MDLLIQELEWGLRNNMEENKNLKEFSYFDSENKEHTILISKDDFKQVNLDKTIHDVKFKNKPTTFFKDALKRFYKNKSSVAGGVILGLLVVLAFILPSVLPSDINVTHLSETFLEPKLFNINSAHIWDGTRYYDSKVAYDTVNNTPAGFRKNAVSELVTWNEKTNSAGEYAVGGDVRFCSNPVSGDVSSQTKYFSSYTFDLDLTNETYNINFKISDENTFAVDGYVNSSYSLQLVYDSSTSPKYIPILEKNSNYQEYTFDLNELIKNYDENIDELSDCKFQFSLFVSTENKTQILITNFITTSSNPDSVFNQIGFNDANKQLLLTKENQDPITGEKTPNVGFWSSTGNKFLYNADITYCNFRYDTYEATYGLRDNVTLSRTEVTTYIRNGWMQFDFSASTEDAPSTFKVLNEEKCPITKVNSVSIQTGAGGTQISLNCEVVYYKYLGYDAMPRFVFGTDSLGKDLLHLVFNGLRISLLLGIITSVINLIIGVIWGSISGYFGGWVDLSMERFTDILGRVPWIVVMTLCILYLGQNFTTFAIALCLTGWMGTAATTRAQFYRFKGREYVLASRTLGASDWRLIFTHILPNSLGTLVTSSVFMIPSVIFTESSLAYLGLGLVGMDSFGVILSSNQQYLTSYSFLILIPSVIMALLMISFNLFGNGLRDAFNPSLKGSD